MAKSSIEWTEFSWNPFRARFIHDDQEHVGWLCTKPSAGCKNCYAEAINKRLGTGLEYTVRNSTIVRPFVSEKHLEQPVQWKKPRRVFVCSMTDLFGEFHTDEMIDRVFAVMAVASQHTFLVLTKRAERMQRYLTELPIRMNRPKELVENWKHIHFGVSCENQKTANERIPWLLKTPAAVRWVSYEPALGPIDFSWLRDHNATDGFHSIDWIVCGGESGTGARPFEVQWARNTIAQCRAASVPVFVKQFGRHIVGDPYEFPSRLNEWSDDDDGEFQGPVLRNKKGADINEWPEDLRVREYPQ